MIPKMPEEYKGKINKNGGYTKSSPRAWTDREIKWVQDLMQKGYSNKEIAESIDRTLTSTAIKIKRLGKKDGSYNADHIKEKYKINDEFLKLINPFCVLDVYAGKKSFYDGKCDVIANDKYIKSDVAYHYDALDFCCKEYFEGLRCDLVDLDPYGSAYDCFDLAIKMAQKGLVITFGELGHKRWKRLDFVSRYYGITDLDDFTLDNLIAHVQMIGLRNKKRLIVYKQKEWRNIGRVWFLIEPYKVTEQWEGKVNA